MSSGRFRTGRKRRIPRVRADGVFLGQGIEVEDAKSGWLFPRRWMVKDCGGLVSRYLKDGSYDLKFGPRDFICDPGAPQRATISIEATDSSASETGPATGTFTITRDGDSTTSFTVYLSITETATSGVDYTVIATSVTFVSGEISKTIIVTPLTDSFDEDTETVTVTILPSDTLDYYIGYTRTQRTNTDFPTQIAPDNFIYTLNNTATVNIEDAPPGVGLLLRYEFNTSPGLLVNSGTLGTSYNLSADAICLG